MRATTPDRYLSDETGASAANARMAADPPLIRLSVTQARTTTTLLVSREGVTANDGFAQLIMAKCVFAKSSMLSTNCGCEDVHKFAAQGALTSQH